jgi:shikimate kinase
MTGTPVSDNCLVLIGPAAVGKSTVGAIVARTLHASFVDLDADAGPAYEEVGQPLEEFGNRIADLGYRDAHRWWQPARAHAVSRLLENKVDAVVALGAGHSHFEDRHYFELVRAALEPHTVILLLPWPDRNRSVQALRERSLATKGHDWVRDGLDYLELWTASPQNLELADYVVYALDQPPQEVASAVLPAARSQCPRLGGWLAGQAAVSTEESFRGNLWLGG